MVYMLKSVTSSVTFKRSQITTISTVINGGLGAFFYILLARFLGPVDYGIVTICTTTMALIADVGDLGTNTGLVRFISASIDSDKHQALRFLKLSLEIKFFVWILILLIGFMLSPSIAVSIFNKPELIIPLRLSMIGVGGAMLFSYVTSSLQALEKFFIWSIVNITTNLLRLIIVVALIVYSQLNIYSGLTAYIVLPFFGFSIGLLFLPAKELLQIKDEFKVMRQLFKYNLSVAIFSAIAAFSSRLDTFLNASFLTSKDIGIYGAANQLTSIMPQIISALGIVLAPRFANFKDNKQMRGYFFKAQLMVLGLSLFGFILVIPTAFFIIPLILGSQYVLSVSPFIILFCSMLVFMISLPVHMSVIYYFSKPDVFIWISLGHLLLIAGLGFLLIPHLGVTGSALTVLAGTIFNLIAPAIWLVNKLQRK